jgi:hypothetical protein
VSVPVELSLAECLDLLHDGEVGRVGLCTPTGPRIVPVNYAMHDRDILVRTAAHSQLATYALNSDVAFEIDHLDRQRHRGWSVVATGHALPVSDPEEVLDIRRRWEPRPWADGPRTLFLKISLRDITGRRLGDDWRRGTMMPVRPVV